MAAGVTNMHQWLVARVALPVWLLVCLAPAQQQSLIEAQPQDDVILVQTLVNVHKLEKESVAEQTVPDVFFGLQEKAWLLKPQDQNSTWSRQATFGLHMNREGDLVAFLYCVAASVVVLLICILVFSYLRMNFPLVYSYNALVGRAPCRPGGGLFDWILPSWRLTVDEVEKTRGLDCAMHMEYHHLCFRLLAYIGLPMMLIMCPLHYHCGGMAAGDDLLSRIGMGNLQPTSWLYWLHGIIVWLVVGVTQHVIYDFQLMAFLPRRFRWLQAIPHPRAATILVENIPMEYCSDAALNDLFCKVVSNEAVESAYVVKKTRKLQLLVNNMKASIKALKAARFEWKKKRREDPFAPRPTFKDIWLQSHDTITFYTESARNLKEQILSERGRILREAADGTKSVYSNNGFVTFTTPIAAKVALQLQFSHNQGEFVTSIPPDPSDVIYTDLQVDATCQEICTLLGHFCSFALFAISGPVVISISYLTNLDSLRHIQFIDRWVEGQPEWVTRVLQGPCASLGLTIWMSLLPTVFMTIFLNCFKLTAHAWAQHQLQGYYYWFMVFFGIVVTAMSDSISWATRREYGNPLHVLGVLATNLPESTHFYLGYMAVQWWLLGLDLTRFWNCIKFLCLRAFYEEAEARELCEPEDQDYYGMGGRSARATYNMLIALVFCSLSPLITLLAFINFGIARLVYAYLFVFAETPKPDLGGVFWVQQLDHLQKGLYVYILLMLGVLIHNSESIGPFVIAAPALFYLHYSYKRFHRDFYWNTLPFMEVSHDEEEFMIKAGAGGDGRYVQPELLLFGDSGPAQQELPVSSTMSPRKRSTYDDEVADDRVRHTETAMSEENLGITDYDFRRWMADLSSVRLNMPELRTQRSFPYATEAEAQAASSSEPRRPPDLQPLRSESRGSSRRQSDSPTSSQSPTVSPKNPWNKWSGRSRMQMDLETSDVGVPRQQQRRNAAADLTGSTGSHR